MAEPSIPLSALAQFHREVILPDMERVVGALERRLRDEMHTLHDSVLMGIERLEGEYQAIRAGLVRVEDRLDALEARLDGLETRLDGLETRLEGLETRLDGLETRLDDLETRLEGLVAAVHRLDERLSRVEKRLDELVGAPREDASRAEV